MNRIKKAIAIALLFIFLYNISGYYFAFGIQILINRFSVEKLLAENNSCNLIVIKISAGEEKKIEWENSGEFRLNGKMYDVAFKKQIGNTLSVYCFQDEKEDHILASLDSQVKKGFDNSYSEKISKNTLNAPIPLFFTGLNSNKFYFDFSSLTEQIQNKFSPCDSFIDQPFPPPRLA